MNKIKYAVYLFDGTMQNRTRTESCDWSNIVRLHALLHQNPPADGELLDMYGDGVGCRINETIFGSTTGLGLANRIEEAYYDLGSQTIKCRNSGDELKVFVFGFSRGAYAARLFCELAWYCGVPTSNGSYNDAYRWMCEKDSDARNKALSDGAFMLSPDIELLGVFDTVAMTDLGKGVDISHVPHNVKHACHAMSYNERRSIFPLTRFSDVNAEEVWFLGSHTDIGGGYVRRGLADLSLEWMVEKANEHGLAIKNEPIVGDRANHEVVFNDSLNFVSKVAGLFVEGRIAKDRIAEDNDLFHWSVQDGRQMFADVKPRLPLPNMTAYTTRLTAPGTEIA